MPEARSAEESTRIWDHKPWWCQPWTIVLSGACGVVASWLLLKLWWLTGLVGLAVSFWWLLFLVLVPRAFSEANQPISTGTHPSLVVDDRDPGRERGDPPPGNRSTPS